MKHKVISKTLLTALCLLSSTAWASTTWYVNGVSGSDSNNCTSPATACKTIKHAISLAASGDSIRVAAGTYTENLTIPLSLNISGASASTTVIDGAGTGRVITVSTGTHVTLSGVTITHGDSVSGAGILSLGTTLTLIRTMVTRNKAHNFCNRHQTCTSGGGGIANQATLTISNSTIAANNAWTGCIQPCGAYAFGVGIFNGGTLKIINSTISANEVSAYIRGSGGGISNSGTLTISNSTISGNGATTGGGGISGTATLRNSIVANNTGGNCSGAMTSNGFNLSSDGSCNFSGPGDLNNTNPMLGPLQYNGGPTQTMALPSGSPAVDAGNPSGCTDGLGHLLKTDQRGLPRPNTEDTGGCDMGAFERQSD
jgi:hypothetical protein